MRFLRSFYGIDFLTLILFLISYLLCSFRYTYIIGYALFLYGLLRIFSTNKYKRKTELNKFIYYLNKPLSKLKIIIPSNLPAFDYDSLEIYIKYIKNKLYQKRHYKIVKCPSCGQKLRLPRKKGNILVTCKRCSYKFDLRT